MHIMEGRVCAGICGYTSSWGYLGQVLLFDADMLTYWSIILLLGNL